jgi:quaternary ammonium compound-resistance protein SugE
MAKEVHLMAWIYLTIAGIMEWGWPVGLKFAWTESGVKALPTALAIISMILSGAFLLLAQRSIPMGTAYAVWTGIGAVGAFILGIAIFGEPAQAARFIFVGFIIVGIIGLKVTSPV